MKATIILFEEHVSDHQWRRKSLNSPIEVIEEAKEVKPEFDEALFLVVRQRAEDFGSVVHVILTSDSVGSSISANTHHTVRRQAVRRTC